MSDGKRFKWRTLAIWLVLIGACIALYSMQSSPKAPKRTDFERFRAAVDGGLVYQVWADGNQIVFQRLESPDREVTIGRIDSDLEQTLLDKGVVFRRSPPPEDEHNGGWLFLFLIPVVVFVVILALLRARAKQGGFFGIQIMEMRKSRAVLVDGKDKVTFADVGGCEDAKLVLGDVVDFLKTPERWIKAGARLPRAVLLDGPPGCGKTLLARAVAGETSAKFYSISASEFVEMFVGVGAARVRDMFETAVKNAPAIVFIDELDAVGRRRGNEITVAGHNEREQTLNQLLVNLDGFKTNDRVVVLAATNRPEILDPALTRPGRIDRRVRVPELSRAARLEVLRIHTRNKRLAAGFSLEEWVEGSDGFNGAQLESLANEAALLAVRRLRRAPAEAIEICREDFCKAMDSVRPKAHQFDKLDEVLIEANSQLARPTGKAVVRVTMSDGTVQEGEIVWADGTFLKILDLETQATTLLPKRHVVKIAALEGTEAVQAIEVPGDPWARQAPEAT